MGNVKATDRLLSRNGTQFRNRLPVFYVPDLDPEKNVIALPIAGASIHLLGPSRDPKQLALMDRPTSAQWLQLDPHQSADGDALAQGGRRARCVWHADALRWRRPGRGVFERMRRWRLPSGQAPRLNPKTKMRSPGLHSCISQQ